MLLAADQKGPSVTTGGYYSVGTDAGPSTTTCDSAGLSTTEAEWSLLAKGFLLSLPSVMVPTLLVSFMNMTDSFWSETRKVATKMDQMGCPVLPHI